MPWRLEGEVLVGQIKIYGVREHLDPIKSRPSGVHYSCIVDALSFPQDNWAHRFFLLEAEDFYLPSGQTPRYTVVEISMCEGRSVETKKNLIRLLFERVQRELDFSPADLEVTITKTPKHNWVFVANREMRLSRLQGRGVPRVNTVEQSTEAGPVLHDPANEPCLEKTRYRRRKRAGSLRL